MARVVAIDTRPLPVPFHNVRLEKRDVTHPLDDTFRDYGVNTVVHLASILRPGHNHREVERVRQANVKSVQSVLKACHAAKVGNFIYLSSHTIYGAHKDNPIPVTEEAPLRTPTAFQYAHDKALCEAEVQAFAGNNPDVSVTVLRSCVVMGPGSDNYVTRAFLKPVLLGVMGHDPPLQFVHEDDLAKLLHLLIMRPCGGTFNVAGEGGRPLFSYGPSFRTKAALLARGDGLPPYSDGLETGHPEGFPFCGVGLHPLSDSR